MYSTVKSTHPTTDNNEDLETQKEFEVDIRIKPQDASFPLCITWTHLPCITWVLPCIGHTGVCPSNGQIHDFDGPYHISVDDFAFGKTYKYLQLDIAPEDYPAWNTAIQKADQAYKRRMHNFFCDNCHSHVACALNHFSYRGKSNYTMVHVWWMLIVKGKYVSWGALVLTYTLWLLVVGIIVCAVVLL